MTPELVISHAKEIGDLRRQADKLPPDNPAALIAKVDLLSRCLVYIGRLSSHLDGEYKRIYAQRKHEHAKAYCEAAKDKTARAELAVYEIRQVEAQAYEDHRRWRNAFDSTTEEIHALKLRLRQDFQIDTFRSA